VVAEKKFRAPGTHFCISRYSPTVRPDNGLALNWFCGGLDHKMTRKDDEMDAQVNNRAKTPGTPDQGKAPSKSSAATKALITRNLRLAYGEVAAEPTPQRLLDLLNSLDSEEKKS
jgi:Anti-sigma factor NepR